MIRDPERHLQKYIEQHFTFKQVLVRSHAQGAYADCELPGNRSLSVRLLLPRQAPSNARPLLASVQWRQQLVWSYKDTFLPNVEWGSLATRVHLHQLEGFFVQVIVKEGDPGTLTEVRRLLGQKLSVEVGAVMKVKTAQLWGLRRKLTRQEKQALNNLTP